MAAINMGKPAVKLLDLFCGAGGAAMGYHQAGFDDIIGIDNVPQPNYPFTFIQADALQPPVNLADFDLIHASPPCQAYSTMTPRAADHPDLIFPTQELLSGSSYVIENVEGARNHLEAPVKLCGSSFGLDVQRHRYLETTFAVMSIPCSHQRRPIGVYGDHPQNDHEYRRPDGTRRGLKARSLLEAQMAMGMKWGTWRETCEAIPPAYTKFIGEQFLAQVAA